MLTLSSFSEQRFLDTMCPDVLNTLSEAELDTQMHKYFFASLAMMGYVHAYTCHQARGFESESAQGAFSYLSISFFILSFGSSGCDAVLIACLLFLSQLPSFILFAGGSV